MSVVLTAAELGAFLVAAKVSSTVPEGLAGFAALAVEEFESRVSWAPFFSTGASESRRFDPPADGVVELRAGLLSVSDVSVGYTSEESPGTSLVIGTGYAVRPGDAWDRGRPVTKIDGLTSLSSPRSVRVTGVWGYALENDKNWLAAKHAVTMGAAALALEHALGSPGEERKLTQGPVTVEYSDGANSRKSQWRTTFLDYCRTVRRQTL